MILFQIFSVLSAIVVALILVFEIKAIAYDKYSKRYLIYGRVANSSNIISISEITNGFNRDKLKREFVKRHLELGIGFDRVIALNVKKN